MAKVAAFLADGFEEVEAIAVIDLLRRAKMEVTTVSIMGRNNVMGSHNIEVKADALFDEPDYDKYDMLFLPGGGVGTKNLKASRELADLINRFNDNKKYLAAICAAPTVYGEMGLLKGKKATCYPGCEDGLIGADWATDKVVRDGNFITSRGAGTAIDLGLYLVSVFNGDEAAKDLAEKIVYR